MIHAIIGKKNWPAFTIDKPQIPFAPLAPNSKVGARKTKSSRDAEALALARLCLAASLAQSGTDGHVTRRYIHAYINIYIYIYVKVYEEQAVTMMTIIYTYESR